MSLNFVGSISSNFPVLGESSCVKKGPAGQIAIFDIDGTLSQCGVFAKFLESNPKDWAAWAEGLPHHALDRAVHRIYLSTRSTHRIWIVTGRSSIHRDVTEKWLSQHGITYDQLIMRPEGNHEDDGTLKVDILNALGVKDDVDFIFEDRDRVVRAYRNAGYKCFQVQRGDF